jgi:hypothetical protein
LDAVLTDLLGFEKTATEGAVSRYRVNDIGPGGVVDLHEAKEFLR